MAVLQCSPPPPSPSQFGSHIWRHPLERCEPSSTASFLLRLPLTTSPPPPAQDHCSVPFSRLQKISSPSRNTARLALPLTALIKLNKGSNATKVADTTPALQEKKTPPLLSSHERERQGRGDEGAPSPLPPKRQETGLSGLSTQ